MQHTSQSEWEKRFCRQEGIVGSELQEALSGASVFIPGLGAIGSAALSALARTGVGHFVLIDDDEIGYENFSSQLFASEGTRGQNKAEVAVRFVHGVHPACSIETRPVTCDVHQLAEIMTSVDVVVLGMDTLSGGIACCRAAQMASRPVVDFLYFATPNVLSTLPGNAFPEERFGYPTRDLTPQECDSSPIAAESLLRVVAYGFSANPGLLEAIGPQDRFTLRRFLRFDGPIPSFAPMTMLVGALMAREAVSLIARSRGFPHPQLAWPAFYLDHYRLSSVVPQCVSLSQMPGSAGILTSLRELRDGESLS
jgi:molybdopterin-synthase adenylyltransferase